MIHDVCTYFTTICPCLEPFTVWTRHLLHHPVQILPHFETPIGKWTW